jgi:hypothetical protein
MADINRSEDEMTQKEFAAWVRRAGPAGRARWEAFTRTRCDQSIARSVEWLAARLEQGAGRDELLAELPGRCWTETAPADVTREFLAAEGTRSSQPSAAGTEPPTVEVLRD